MPQENKQQFQCTGNCLQCLPAQRAYCASQHAYSNMRVLDKVIETLSGMQEDIRSMQDGIAGLSVKIEAIQSGEADLFDPNGGFVEDEELFPKITEKQK